MRDAIQTDEHKQGAKGRWPVCESKTEDASSAAARLDGKDNHKRYPKTDCQTERDRHELQRGLEAGKVHLVEVLARVGRVHEREQASIGHAGGQLEQNGGDLQS